MAEQTQNQGHGHASSERTSSTGSSTATFPMLQTTPSGNYSKSPPTKLPCSPTVSHRSSLAENLRGHPASPRQAHRSPSLSQQAFMDLINNPPTKHSHESEESQFAGRDWRSITVGEVVDLELVRFVEMDTSVEEATNILITSGSPNVVLLRENKASRKPTGTFDYNDLNAYLLLVVGLAQPEDRQSFKELAQKGREGKPIPLRDVKDLSKKEPLFTLPDSADLTKAVEILGSGVHRIVIVGEKTGNAVGVLTQLRMIEFFWDNERQFKALRELYQATLRDLNIGAYNVYAINGDKPLTDALELMNNESITSLPVLDNQNNVIGNISHVDVRLLTKNTALPLLRSSCIHFISVILSERGMFDGKDSYPVFHVTPLSTLAHTVAKLVATRSHRMWIVQPPSPASSTPATPSITPLTTSAPPSALSSSPSSVAIPPTSTPSHSGPPYTIHPSSSSTAVSASATPGASLSGRLSGVISLTDVLNLFARASGLNPHDPGELRQLRRRSSSASATRRSVESSRSESVGGGSSVAGSRRGSISGNRRPPA